MKKIQDIERADRPREKLKAKGPRALSDFELLQALVGSGNQQADVSMIARDTQNVLHRYGIDVTYEQLEQIVGLGNSKITEILAAFELSKRYLTEYEQPILDNPEKVVAQLAEIRDKKQEYFVSITLDGANRMLAKRTISIGTLVASLVHPREVFADAITDRAASIVIAHNHPSGELEPSMADKEVTIRIRDAGLLLGVKLLDHLVVTKTSHRSIQ